jgi:1-acyl-sn-glycerol-3-phosphate acyltransferase
LTATVARRAPGRLHRLGFAFLILQLGLMSLAWCLVSPVLSALLPRRFGTWLGRSAISFVYRCCWKTAERIGMMRVDSSALDVLRNEPGGLIIAGNHPTMLDALIVVARLPRGVCIMKAELLRNIFLGAGARLARYIRNDSGRRMVRDAVTSLKEGAQLVLFPEGTRTVCLPINDLKPGITLIAHLARVPIQTIVIESDSPYLTKGWPLLRPPPGPVVIRLRLGERFAPTADHRTLLRRLDRHFRYEVER